MTPPIRLLRALTRYDEVNVGELLDAAGAPLDSAHVRRKAFHNALNQLARMGRVEKRKQPGEWASCRITDDGRALLERFMRRTA